MRCPPVARARPLLCGAVLLLFAAGTGGQPAVSAAEATWAEVDRLVGEQKYEAAAASVARLRASAQARGDEEDWARALVREVQLRSALHGYETSVRLLRESPWPQGARSRLVLEAFYGQSLVGYLRAYGWEIRQRERIDSKDLLDLKKWTAEEIGTEAARAYARVWAERGALGAEPASRLGDYLQRGSYPDSVRGRLRDVVAYLFVELLSDTSHWTPAQHELHRLSVDALLGPVRAKVDDPAVHPLVRVAAVLTDLEDWHTAAARRDAALEARLERLRRLHASLTRPSDRARIRADLEGRLGAFRDLEWWSVGQAQLAEFVQAEEAPDALVRARAIAERGVAAYPETIGGQQCASLIAAIESPAYTLTSMTLDGPRRRSVQVDHKNLVRLFFRAYAVDLDVRLRTSRDYNLLPGWPEVPKLIADARPEAEWSVDLPWTPDYRLHRTYVTPPLDRPGLYVVVASARADFNRSRGENQLQAVNLLVSDLVLVHRVIGDALEVAATSGRTGEAVAGAAVEVWQLDWQKGHHRVATLTSGADGTTRADAATPGATSAPGWRPGTSVALLGRHGEDLSLAANVSWNIVPPPGESSSALVYTDRSVYRPHQKILWKVVAYEGGGEDGRFQTSPRVEVEVELQDANGDTVETREVVTNEFGSAAGEFVIPSGRMLGEWSLETSAGGHAVVRVEEYKRPTFEVALVEPKQELRLGQAATLTGTARYYFGLPVTAGTVSWSVTRHAVRPWWWGWWGDVSSSAPLVVAGGETRLRDDGGFTLTFEPAADPLASREWTWTYEVSAHVTDEGGETRSAARRFRLGFVAVEARLQDAPGFVRAGHAASVQISRTDLDGTPRAGAAAWTLVRLRQPERAELPADQPVAAGPAGISVYRTAGDNQRSRHDPRYTRAEVLRLWKEAAAVTRGRVTHDAKGEAAVALPALSAGVYRLRYETKDAFGAVFRMAHDMVVAEPRDTPLALPGMLAVERGTVRVGGTARLFVHSGFPGQPMTLELWRGGRRREVRRLVAGRSPQILELPISEKERGGFAATLTLVRDHQLVQESASIFVPWDDRALEVRFSTFRDTLRPGGRETWRVTVASADARREPTAAAEVLASMYDRSLDLFAPHEPLDALTLYPSHAGGGHVQANLGGAGVVWSEGWLERHAWHSLSADTLDFWRGYAFGGPGARNVVSLDSIADGVEGGVPGGVVGGVVGGLAEQVQIASALPLNGRSFQQLALLTANAPATPEPVTVRSDFSETAFWSPQLLTGPDGAASFEFTVPDSVTSWKVWARAVTRDLRAGAASAQARTVKDLMVRPYLPRFLREGDRAEIRIVINNAADRALSGSVDLEIRDPETNESRLDELGVRGGSLAFTAPASGSTHVTVPLLAPKRAGAVVVKVIARAGDLSDGEQRLLPLLPSRLHLVESRFAAVKGAETRTLSFPALARTDDTSRETDRLVVTLDAQLFYGVLQALPYLVNYPYECTEQTLNRFVSTGILSSLFEQHPAVGRMAAEMARRETRFEPWAREDPNRRMQLEETPWLALSKGGAEKEADLARVLDPKIARATREEALAKLEKSQTSLGGFPWWPGGPPSPYMTLYLVSGLSHSREFGAEVPKEMVRKAFSYLHRHYVDDWVRRSISCGCGWEFVTFLNYVLTSYPDDSWTGGVFAEEERRTMLDFSFRHWKEHSPYSKGQLALTLHRRGRAADARLVWDSVMDSAKTDADTGTSWAPEDRAWLWYNDTIETHAFALRTLTELAPRDTRREGLVQWLFLHKKLNHWSSTRATAEVVYSLAHYLKQEGQLGIREAATVTAGSHTQAFVFEPDQYTGKANHVVVPGHAVDAERVSAVVVQKTTPGMLFASATWHYSTDRLPDDEAGDLFAVSRRYFRRDSRQGTPALVPIAPDTPIAPGDELEVQLSLRAKQAAEYVHLRDPRGAGFEPVTLVSGFKWQTGIGVYEEVRDSGANFFFEWLPAGEYTFRYRLRAATAGTFRVGPAQVQSIYAPEFAARSAGAVLEVSGESTR